MLRQEPLVIDDFLGHWIEGLPSKMALLELEQLIGDWALGLARYNGGDEMRG